MGSHELPGKTNEWYTPKYIFNALNVTFDTDVASPIDKKHCCVPAWNFISDDSLNKTWNGFVWMNPPFGNMKNKFLWLNKFISHGNGIALTPDRTSAPWWQHTAENTDAVLFVSGKIKFITQNGEVGESPSTGTTLFGVGDCAIKALENAKRYGLGILYKR